MSRVRSCRAHVFTDDVYVRGTNVDGTGGGSFAVSFHDLSPDLQKSAINCLQACRSKSSTLSGFMPAVRYFKVILH